MSKFFISLAFLLLIIPSWLMAETVDCFLVKDGDKILINEGQNCDIRYSPASTFKIPLAIMGYESGILKDRHSPVWTPKNPVNYLKYHHDGPQSPSSWMRFSVVWYSQILTSKLGADKFQKYIDKINYGNKDLSGNYGKNDGLTESWISSSLLISPLEQVEFIEKLAQNQLPFSEGSQNKTKDLMKLMEESLLSEGYSIHGKTGTDVDKKTQERRGYFVGFAEKKEGKNNKIISFAIHITGEKDSKVGGIYAKKTAIDRMMKEVLNV
jgi:beta-lactamase class D